LGVVLRLYDTATREVRELALRDPGTVSIYLCGPTVYGPPHLGHGRATLEYDILRRYLTWCGLDVRLVSNVTDIEDKIIERAEREGRDPAEVAIRCEAVWWDAMDRIGFQRPTDIPHATEWVDEMVEMIGQLLEIGRAYRTDDGVYLSVRSVEDYGLLAQQDLDDMLAGGGERGVVGAEGKRDQADFALWKLAKPGEPSWPSPWGDGRPGWHSECVVMSLGLLGEGFDLHAGGLDLKFPHHENERAQAVALGQRFAEHWMHHAFVVDRTGEKMSKSLGNYENLLDFTEQHDPRSFRLMLLQAHYRSPVSMDAELAGAAERTLAGLDAFARRAVDIGVAEPDAEVLARFRERMDDDLDTPGAMAVVFDTVRRANAAIDSGSPDAAPLVAAVREMTGAVGLELGGVEEVPAEVAERVADLDAARAARDYAAADAIRAELQAEGWTVETTATGTTVHR
jgi:cysteinyl-tRNA synthetase